ncbi:MarR family transcriptional regulator [Microbacterium sp. BG28]|uniref:MarR family winged helix-turn-helix transcriptional regulator n=1 Tax=Microbacterium sp. BG28 TaxID=3097356 RepID=UPI002A5A76AF|nr:MarR family transcriptional regulator [Microbacterium sp. BG28]MDY0830661.1 MarR family transcriptional regulator [Microbacterium sp. BG28]
MSDRAMYWYDAHDVRQHAGRRVLDALRTYRASEMAMRRRTQESMGMGENDLLVLQYLMRAAKRGREVSPGDIGHYLSVSTPSVTGILDRLERSGHLKRKPHPRDRRRLLVETTDLAHVEVRRTLDGMHTRMMAAVRSLDPGDADAIVDFLHAMTDAVGAGDTPLSAEVSTA